jgi:hypothetical protein
MSMLDGISNKTYETKKTRRIIEYWLEVKSKSAARPPVFALLSTCQWYQKTEIQDKPNICTVEKSHHKE